MCVLFLCSGHESFTRWEIPGDNIVRAEVVTKVDKGEGQGLFMVDGLYEDSRKNES